QEDNRPVEKVSWNDTQDFIKKLNKKAGKTYRLPTEAEWEFAAQGGIYTEGYKYSGSDRLKEVGWYDENSGNATHPVGEKMANELGLYDMSGNVWEWVEDQWHDNYKGAPTDGTVWVNQDADAGRVVRGGGWIDRARLCRVSFRYLYSPAGRNDHIGFRLALSLQSAG
ncbi:MAG: formylglycine-generating enzyme family protein, partial [Leptospiraceae bacterium]|nr:formylglycine-generating enzyme family protein [Leptospiraceae bacterium]